MNKRKLTQGILLITIVGLVTACGKSNEETASESLSTDNTVDSSQSDSNAEVADQLELEIGDTATIESTIGTYEITLNDMQYHEEIEGEISDLEIYLIADYTLRNVGEEDISAVESTTTLELTDYLDGSGQPDIAGAFEKIEYFSDDQLKPGDEVHGQAVYESYDADTFYVRAVQGLVASGGLKNDVLFTIEKEEME